MSGGARVRAGRGPIRGARPTRACRFVSGWVKEGNVRSLFHPAPGRATGLLLALALIGGAPAAADAQGPTNPLSPGLPQSPAPTQTAPPTAPQTTSPATTNAGSTASSGGGFSGTDAAEIAIGAIIVLGGISLFIWRDARRRAPIRQSAAAATAGIGGRARSGSKPRGKPRKPSPAERRRRKRGRAR